MDQRPSIQRILVVVLAAWVFTVIAVYYVAHKPFRLENSLALGRAAAGFGGAGLIVALGTGIGLLALKPVDLGPAERLVWAGALGLGVVSLVGLVLGAAGLLRPWLLWTLTAVGVAVTARTSWRALKKAWNDPTWRPRGRFQVLLAGYCGVILVIGLVWALVPPTAWDGLVYHLTVPQMYLSSGWISHPIDLPYLGFPQLTEMLFTWGMGIVGERAASPIHWFYGTLTIFSLVTLGSHGTSQGSGWLTSAILLSGRTVISLLGWPYVDLALLLYGTLTFMALVRWADSDDIEWLGLTGIFAGFSLSTKYTALAVLPALGVALFLFRVSKRRSLVGPLHSTVRDTAIAGALALGVWAPWLIKNVALTGNPAYPFFLDGIHWDGWRSWWYDRPGTGLAFTSPWRLLSAPWDATVWGVEGARGYSATVGPLFLALTPLLLVAWRRFSLVWRRWLRSAVGFTAVLYAFWLWGVARTALLRQTRLLLPAGGLLATMSAAAVHSLRKLPGDPVDLGWLARAVIVGVLALTLIGTLLSTVQEQPLKVLLGFESREEFLTRRLGWYYPTIQHLNENLPSESTVLFLWEPRTYHCSADCRPDALLDRWLHAIHLYGHDSGTIADAWREDGITHVLLHRAGLNHILEADFDPVTKIDLRVLDKLQTEHMTLAETFGSAYELYRLEKR